MTGLDGLFRLLTEKGGARYGSEPVSQLEHALQCAALAEENQAPESLIVAALLHDIGHLASDDEGLAARGRDARHEIVGAALLSRYFGPEVTEPVRLHVAAKRYLCATEARYGARLSRGSVTSLKVQGGLLSAAEVERFAKKTFFDCAIALRRWDDAAKTPGAPTPGLESYQALAEKLSRGWRQGRLILVVGPSGAGKDTLIAAARERLANDSRFHFPLRVITRAGDTDREVHDSVSETEFRQMEEAGAFCLSWRAHGLHYGVPASVATALSLGHRVIVNVSRGIVERACERFPNVRVLHVTAAPAAIAARLQARPGMTVVDQQERLARHVDWRPEQARMTEVGNDGLLAESLVRFLDAITAS